MTAAIVEMKLDEYKRREDELLALRARVAQLEEALMEARIFAVNWGDARYRDKAVALLNQINDVIGFSPPPTPSHRTCDGAGGTERPRDRFGNFFVECRGILAHRYGVLAPTEDEICKCEPGNCVLDAIDAALKDAPQ